MNNHRILYVVAFLALLGFCADVRAEDQITQPESLLKILNNMSEANADLLKQDLLLSASITRERHILKEPLDMPLLNGKILYAQNSDGRVCRLDYEEEAVRALPGESPSTVLMTTKYLHAIDGIYDLNNHMLSILPAARIDDPTVRKFTSIQETLLRTLTRSTFPDAGLLKGWLKDLEAAPVRFELAREASTEAGKGDILVLDIIGKSDKTKGITRIKISPEHGHSILSYEILSESGAPLQRTLCSDFIAAPKHPAGFFPTTIVEESYLKEGIERASITKISSIKFDETDEALLDPSKLMKDNEVFTISDKRQNPPKVTRVKNPTE